MNINTLFPSKYVKAADLNGRRINVTISRVSLEQMGNPPERKPVLYFEKAAKGLVMNKTIGMSIAHLHGDETDGWKGKRITLYPTQVSAFGKMNDVIRVAGTIPADVTNGAKATEETEATEAMNDAEDI